MKKLIAVTLGLLMLLTLAACGGKTGPEKTDPEAVLAEETPAPAPAEEDEGAPAGTEADIDGACEYTGSKVMISWSESNELANFINITK